MQVSCENTFPLCWHDVKGDPSNVADARFDWRKISDAWWWRVASSRSRAHFLLARPGKGIEECNCVTPKFFRTVSQWTSFHERCSRGSGNRPVVLAGCACTCWQCAPACWARKDGRATGHSWLFWMRSFSGKFGRDMQKRMIRAWTFHVEAQKIDKDLLDIARHRLAEVIKEVGQRLACLRWVGGSAACCCWSSSKADGTSHKAIGRSAAANWKHRSGGWSKLREEKPGPATQEPETRWATLTWAWSSIWEAAAVLARCGLWRYNLFWREFVASKRGKRRASSHECCCHWAVWFARSDRPCPTCYWGGTNFKISSPSWLGCPNWAESVAACQFLDDSKAAGRFSAGFGSWFAKCNWIYWMWMSTYGGRNWQISANSNCSVSCKPYRCLMLAGLTGYKILPQSCRF